MRDRHLRRVHVIGGPGSGKTTLGRQLAVRLGVPLTDLDEIAYVGGAGAKRPPAERLADVGAIAARPAWITEGIYLWWADDLFRAADAIIWLDLPWRVAAWRIVLRHIRSNLAGTNPHPGVPKLWRFLRSTRKYYIDASAKTTAALNDDDAITRALTAREIAPYADKLVRCSDSAEVSSFLSSVR